VYSLPYSNGSILKVTWSAGESFGSAVSRFAVEWMLAPFVTWTGYSSVDVVPALYPLNSSYEWYIPVLRNYSYAVRVRQYNEQGASPPSWYPKISAGSYFVDSFSTAADYHDGSQIAQPTCVPGLDECVEMNPSLILARALPGPPSLTVPTPLQASAAPPFSRSWVVVYFDELEPNGDVIDKYRVEWDEVSTFSSTMKVSAVTSNAYFNISGLNMGETYYIRVFAHSSIGYGSASETYSYVPMQQPDSPSKPTLKVAEDSSELVVYARSLNVSWQYPAISGPGAN
jgi:hypothetical protein